MTGWMQSWDNHMFPKEFGWSGIISLPRELEWTILRIQSYREGHIFGDAGYSKIRKVGFLDLKRKFWWVKLGFLPLNLHKMNGIKA